MILLDTNVVSEVMRPTPQSSVIEWLNERDTATLYLSTMTIAEIGYGLRVLPDGKRRRGLEERFDKFVSAGFDHRILDFDLPAAKDYGEVMSQRRSIGRPMGVLDGQTAAIARVHGFAIATRNVRDFQDCALEILNPFEADSV